MAQNRTGVADIALPVNYVLMRGMLRQARGVCPYFNGTVPGTLERNGGSMSVKWERWGDLAVSKTPLGEVGNPLAFGMGRDTAVPTLTPITAAIAKYGNAVAYTEELDLFQINARAAGFLTVLGRNCGQSLNELMRDVFNTKGGYTAAQADIYSGGTSRATVDEALSANNVRYATNLLQNAGAYTFEPMTMGSQNIGTSPIREAFLGIVHVDQETDVRALPGFVGVEAYASQTRTYVGEVGAALGVRWIMTRFAPVETTNSGGAATSTLIQTSSTNDIYSWFIYGQDAFGSVGLGEMFAKEIYELGDMPPAVQIIQHAPGSSGVGDMYNEIGSVAWKAWWAGKDLNSAWCVKGLSGATKVS